MRFIQEAHFVDFKGRQEVLGQRLCGTRSKPRSSLDSTAQRMAKHSENNIRLMEGLREGSYAGYDSERMPNKQIVNISEHQRVGSEWSKYS